MKKIVIFLLISVFMLSCCVSSASAADADDTFTDDLPKYVDYSGGAWFEIFDSSLGRCTVIFPIEFKNCSFGFELSGSGVPVNIINFTNSTIYGFVITSDGTKYNCRASRFSEIEYQTTGSYNTYVALSPSTEALSNSNMLFITDDVNYINDTVPDYDKYFLFIFAFIGLCELLSLCSNLLRRGSR